MTRPAASGVIPTASVYQSTDRVQPMGGGDMSELSGIAQILAMMQASQQQANTQAADREARLAAQAAEREASMKMELARLAAREKERDTALQ